MKKKSVVRVLLVLLMAVAGASAFWTRSSDASSKNGARAWRSKLSPDLLEKLDRGDLDDSQFDVIIKGAGRMDVYKQDVVQAFGGFVRPERSLTVIDGMSVRMSLRQIRKLAARNEFSYISADRPVKVLGHIETTTGAAQIRNLVQGFSGVYGNGVGIAIIDSGIDETHHELNFNWNDRVIKDIDAGNFGNTADQMGHGTHVASVACGTNHVGPGAYTGIAPGANIINLKVLDGNGVGYSSQIINAINWCVSYRNVYNIRVINLSLGAPAVDSYRNDPLCQAVRAAHDAGIVVVAAAGNDGKDQNGNKLYGTIHSPGIEPSAITVGAANTFGTDSRSDDGVTTYSSRGPTRGYYTDQSGQKVYDNLVKPDLIAPGNKIIAAEAYGCNLVTENPGLDASQYESNPHHNIMYLSGTSVSAPVVSGAAALLLQVNPNLTPNLVKAILTYTAQPLKGFNLLEQGAGEVNIDGAVRLAKQIHILGRYASNGQPMLSGSMPTQQSTIAGYTFQWSQGVITNWTFLYGSQLMTNWQGMYGQQNLLCDGTVFSGGSIVKNDSQTTSGVQLGAGMLLSDGSVLSSGMLLSDSTDLANGMLLSDGTAFADGMLMSDGMLLADGMLLSDGMLMSDSIVSGGDPGGMSPQPDSSGN